MASISDVISALDGPAKDICQELTAVIGGALPDAGGQVWHGQPVWMRGKEPVAGFKPYPRWVTFMIWNGAPIDEGSGRLVHGSRMATVKIASVEEVDRALTGPADRGPSGEPCAAKHVRRGRLPTRPRCR